MKIAGIIQEHHLHQSSYEQLRKEKGKGTGRGGKGERRERGGKRGEGRGGEGRGRERGGGEKREGRERRGKGRGGRILFSWLILISLYSKHASVKTAACSKYRILQLIQKRINISETCYMHVCACMTLTCEAFQ